MTISHTEPAMDVEVISALPEHEPILANMFELYAHDFSEFVDIQLGPDGRFGCKRLHLYWEESDRYPFIITFKNNLAGFVLVRKGSAISNDVDVWDMAEFFIVRGFRRLGVGTRVAREIWGRFQGRWQVRVIDRNPKAMEFWRRAINVLPGEAIEPIPFIKDGQGWHVFSFESECAA